MSVRYTAVACDPGLSPCLDRVAKLGFRRRLNQAADPDEALELIASDYSVYAFDNRQRQLWAEQANGWQVRVDVNVEVGFALRAAESGSPELAERLIQDAARRVRTAREALEQ